MAQRRMFSKTITNSSQFLMMPESSQNLYFHLGMNADDDGFVEHFGVMRMTGAKPDDLKILALKKFVGIFDDKVLVVLDWKENNYIRSDRYTPSKYLQIYKEELELLSIGIPSGIPVVDAGKDRIGKVRLGNKKGEEVELPDFIDREVWNEWTLYRKEKGQSLTPTSIKRQLKFLGENQKDYKAIIEASIQNGWTGLFALKKDNKKNQSVKNEKYDKFNQ